jgi:hypothetical protein
MTKTNVLQQTLAAGRNGRVYGIIKIYFKNYSAASLLFNHFGLCLAK